MVPPITSCFCALCLEPFLCRVRQNPDIMGIRTGDSHYKLSAYADDLLFSLTKPGISLPNLLRELDQYGSLSNLKINMLKSEAMGVSMSTSQIKILKANFRWTVTALKYLGTLIPPKLNQIYALNFPPLLSRVRTLLSKWHQGLYSWFGRCNIIKMSILPKFVYLFQTLPIYIPPEFF